MHLGNQPTANRTSADEDQGITDTTNAMFSALKLEDTEPAPDSVPCYFTQSSNPRRKFYVVPVGRQTGIFDDWNIAQRSYQGYSSGSCKKYNTLQDAKAAWASYNTNPEPIEEPLGKGKPPAGRISTAPRPTPNVTGVDMETGSTSGTNAVLGPISASINRNAVAGSSPVGSGSRAVEEYWVVTRGENPGVYVGYDNAVQRGIGSATRSLQMHRFHTRQEAEAAFVREYMSQNVVAI